MKSGDLKELARPDGDLERLKEDWEYAVRRRDSTIFSRQRLNYRARYTIWPNQSEDGRKWIPAKGDEHPRPWRGASDMRVPLIDKYVMEQQALDLVVWRRSTVNVSGTEVNDLEFGSRLTQVLRWMKMTQMTEARREMKLISSWRWESGASILGVFWDRRSQLGYDQIDMESVQAIAMEAQGRTLLRVQAGLEPEPTDFLRLKLSELIMTERLEAQAAEVMAREMPDLKKSRVLQIVRDLRETGTARFPRPYLVRNRPCLVALKPNEDIFLPPEATSLQDSPAIHRRELIPETALRERGVSSGWDAAWIKDMLETQRGRITDELDGVFGGSSSKYGTRRVGRSHNATDATRLFEVVHSYRRLSDDEGVPGIYYTCWSPGLGKHHAFHELLNYDDGEYPFVWYERETRGRLLDDSRGVGEILNTFQEGIKGLMDAERDWAGMSVLPPSYHPPGKPPEAWGPGVQVGTITPDRYGFFQTPRYQPGSEATREMLRKFADEYMGRPVDENTVVLSQIITQAISDDWMECNRLTDFKIVKLMQQFMPEQFYYRVVGSAKARPIRASREEIQGSFDIDVTYSTGLLNSEIVVETMNLMKEWLAMDSQGIVDRAAVMEVMGEMISPNLGERVLRPSEEASQAEIEDEETVYVKLMAGIPVDVRPGQAFQLRLQWWQGQMQQNPQMQQQFQENEGFRELAEKRIKQLNHQVQQTQVNPRIGVLGA